MEAQQCPSYITRCLQRSETYRNGDLSIFADIENCTIGGGTVPPYVIATSQKPDIVLVWSTEKKVILFELTVPFEPNIINAHQTKIDRYSSLVSNIADTGFDCSLIAIEIGSRGLIDTDNKKRMTSIFRQLKSSTKYSELKNKISKSVLTSSYSIYNARHEPEWNIQELI